MFIKKVEGNVKAGANVEIGEKTLVVGPNGSGKSTIVNVVELALTGRAGDIAGRTDIAREADVMALAQKGASSLAATVQFDTGETASYTTSGSTAKAKKSVNLRPAFATHDEVLPIRTLREAVLGSPQTARKFLMGKVSTATLTDIETLIPAALTDRFHQSMPANVPVADGLVAAIEYAAKAARDANSDAKTQREAAKLVSGGRAAPPTEAEVKAATQALKDARAKLVAIEDQVNLGDKLAEAEEKLSAIEEKANDAAIHLTNARTALNALKKPKDLNPLLPHVCMVMDESVLAGECLSCGGPAPSKASANEVSAAIADTVAGHKAYDKMASEVAAAEGFAKATLEILDKQEALVASLKSAGPVPTDAEIAAAEQAVTAAEDKVLNLKASRDAWLKVQQAESAALDAERQSVEWKALKEAMENAMALTLEKSLAAFIEKVQSYLPKTDTFDLRLRDGEREVVQFGLVRDGVLHTALSGAEWARVTAAMASACVGDDKFAVIIPEERAFDPATLKDVMISLGESIHQVILTSPVAPKSVPKGWTVVKRGE